MPTDEPVGEPERDEAAESLTDLRFVGQATADALREQGLDARAIRKKRVSYEMLLDAGVNPGIATQLRREYSLPWSRERTHGANLRRRSAQVRTLQDEERAWIDASTEGWENPEADAEGVTTNGSGTADPIGGDSPSDAAALEGRDQPACPRCGGDLSMYTLGDRRRVVCEACGYTGVNVTLSTDSEEDESWDDAFDRFSDGS